MALNNSVLLKVAVAILGLEFFMSNVEEPLVVRDG